MKDIISSSRTLLVALAAGVSVSSCSLPPREAWRMIQQDGLIAFLSNDKANSTPSAAPILSAPCPPAIPAIEVAASPRVVLTENPQYQGPPKPVAVAPVVNVPAKKPTVEQPRITTPEPERPAAAPSKEKPLMATAVPSLPGFVRSPYTIPPRLVDVKGSTPGSTMICPYTKRPFIIPSDFVSQIPSVASNAPKTQSPANTANNKPPVNTTPSTASSTPANSLFNKPVSPAPMPEVTKTAPQEIPYGMPIPGRPGFVNSPYAAKHQLVDVTGLPVGMEVKCPYTGKLFRVPAQDIAQQKSVAAPGSLPATDKAEKK